MDPQVKPQDAPPAETTAPADPPGGPSPPPTRQRRGLTRRRALQYGLAGLAGLAGLTCAGVAVWPWLRRRFWDEGVAADIFKGDAPDARTFALWQSRGWAKEAMHYLRLGRNTQCKLCPNNCLLEPGDRSHCRNKVNVDGVLYTLAYANPCSFAVDPIEKKPLYHYLPGSLSFSLATAGCVFRCLNCQNWTISQSKPEQTKSAEGPDYLFRPPVPPYLTADQQRRLTMLPEDVVALADALSCRTVSYTYTEPIAFYEYVFDTARLARQRRVGNVLVTCGYINERPLRELARYVEAAHVDLKGFDEDTYRTLNGGQLEPVKNTLKTLKEMGVWVEVINLIVPTYTDKPDTIRAMCGWICQELGADCPVHFSRFKPEHKLTRLPPTPQDMLLQARSIGREEGLRYVYIGNLAGLPDAGTTFCPNCQKAVVERGIFAVTASHLEAGCCKFCRQPIAGVWSV